MASILPFLQDLLPMIIPAPIHITRGVDLEPSPAPVAEPEAPKTEEPQDEERPEAMSQINGHDRSHAHEPEPAVTNRNAIVNKSDKLCAAVLRARPTSSSPVYHNGEQDAIVYAVAGRAILATQPEEEDAEPQRHELSPGDFVLVPAWTEHQMINDSDDEVVWVVVRSGPSPTIVNLTEWGGPEATPSKPKWG